MLWCMHAPLHAHNYTKLCVRGRAASSPEPVVRARSRLVSGPLAAPNPSVWGLAVSVRRPRRCMKRSRGTRKTHALSGRRGATATPGCKSESCAIPGRPVSKCAASVSQDSCSNGCVHAGAGMNARTRPGGDHLVRSTSALARPNPSSMLSAVAATVGSAGPAPLLHLCICPHVPARTEDACLSLSPPSWS